ncbi:hypothetical protein FB451DRAFT_1231109 [Mycena latifolia]|nr:hypothetical protein FB451DRAFT_1231109 [Mycena latifolia]
MSWTARLALLAQFSILIWPQMAQLFYACLTLLAPQSNSFMSSPMSGTSPASTSSSRASSPGVGVYVPVHRRTNSASSSRSIESISPPPKSYTPAELLQLAQSPLATQLSTSMRASLEPLAELAQRRGSWGHRDGGTPTGAVVSKMAAPPRRRSIGRSFNRKSPGLKVITEGLDWRLAAQARARLEAPGRMISTAV